MTMNRGWRGPVKAQSAIRRLAWTGAAMAAMASVGGAASAAGPERSLAGISIFAPGSEVTRKFGNPSRILVGGVGTSSAASSATGTGPSGSSGSSSGGYPGGSAGPSSSPNPGAGLLPGFQGVAQFGQQLGNTLNQISGGEFGGSSGSPGDPGGYPGGSGGAAVPAGPPPKQPVTLIYDRANGGSLEFTISPDKRVIQIRETGYVGAYGTARGIKLGTSYAQVVAHYGYPEDTYIQGPIISTDYKDTLHCGFQFLDQKLVGIIVASPD